VYQDRNSSFDEHGVWQVEQSDRSVRLQQEGKDTTSSAYQILSKDEIKMLDSEGKPIDTPLNYSLHRKPA
jgi:copper homeostasis protein (lipoprotein)